MRSSSNSCIKNGKTDRGEALNTECDSSHCQNRLYIVGIGPGAADHMSKRASDVLRSADTVVGYTTYIDLIRPLTGDKKVVATPMMKEVERVETAIDMALKGRICALVSGGDPGIYAMAGLVFEMCEKKDIPIKPPRENLKSEIGNDNARLQVEVVPGIPAVCAGASLLGAPLTHDFAVISLSDLLTPWDVIEQRIEAAAKADFVIVIYNPKSKKRNWQLRAAQKIILRHRHKNTPVGIVTSAMREEQQVEIRSLEDLDTASVNMQTTVFVGSSASVRFLDFMLTPRGYSKKYQIPKV